MIRALIEMLAGAPADLFLVALNSCRAFGHVVLARQRANINGVHAQSFGLRFGWWPCLRGPFVRVHFFCWTLDLWWGFPTYKVKT